MGLKLRLAAPTPRSEHLCRLLRRRRALERSACSRRRLRLSAPHLCQHRHQPGALRVSSWIQGALVVSAAPACRADGPVTRVRIVARLDPRLPFVPGFLIAFVLKVAAPYIFRQVRSLPLPVRALALTGQLCGGYALLSAHAFGWIHPGTGSGADEYMRGGYTRALSALACDSSHPGRVKSAGPLRCKQCWTSSTWRARTCVNG